VEPLATPSPTDSPTYGWNEWDGDGHEEEELPTDQGWQGDGHVEHVENNNSWGSSSWGSGSGSGSGSSSSGSSKSGKSSSSKSGKSSKGSKSSSSSSSEGGWGNGGLNKVSSMLEYANGADPALSGPRLLYGAFAATVAIIAILR